MGTGVSPRRIATGTFLLLLCECRFLLRSPPLRGLSLTPKLLYSLGSLRKTESKLPFCSSSQSCALAPWQLDNVPNPYFFLRKEVIQPHLPIRLPCYDFTPVISPAFDSSLFSVGSLASGVTDSHGVTGGVYKTRERIHRGILIRDY